MDYNALREDFRPEPVNLLFIAEAPPYCVPPRFFYDINTKSHDHLYLEIMTTLFLNHCGRTTAQTKYLRSNKALYLEKFKEYGFWLQDVVPVPAAHISFTQAHLNRILDIIKKHDIKECILIKKSVFNFLNEPLLKHGVKVLNSNFLPFPASGHAANFRNYLYNILIRNGYSLPLKDC